MKRRNMLLMSMASLVAGLSAQLGPNSVAWAQNASASETVRFIVENMTCALCPLTVKTAMANVEGVRSVEIDFDAKTATVEFDPSVTSAALVAAASENAGYPATPAS